MLTRSALVVSTELAHFAMVRPVAVFLLLDFTEINSFLHLSWKSPMYRSFLVFACFFSVAVALVSLGFIV